MLGAAQSFGSSPRLSSPRFATYSSTTTIAATMDSFENFQNDSASSYGGMGIVDDTSSVYTATTSSQSNIPVIDFDGLSIVDDRSTIDTPDEHGHGRSSSRSGLDEDFDGVLDDLKDEGQVDLPPHACR